MSIRDKMAIEAMGAIIGKLPLFDTDKSKMAEVYEKTARGAYAYADAMLEARNGK